jgi:membrane-bound serine protease (ClpP class)
VALILFAFILFGLELFVPSSGILGIGGAVSLLLGGLLLTSDNPPEFQVSRWLIFLITGMLLMLVIVIVGNAMRIRRMAPLVGVETMVGKKGVARSDLDPQGFVYVNGEYWSAEAEDESVSQGDSVIITAIKGLKVKVKKQQSEGAKE